MGRLKTISRDEVARLWWTGLTQEKIAAELGTNQTSIARICAELGLRVMRTRRNRSGKDGTRIRKLIGTRSKLPPVSDLIALLETGHTLRECAELYQVTRERVRQVIQREIDFGEIDLPSDFIKQQQRKRRLELREKVRELYLDGRTPETIALTVGRSLQYVNEALVGLRHKQSPRRDEVLELHNRGMTGSAIARQLGIAQGGVSRILVRCGIRTRAVPKSRDSLIAELVHQGLTQKEISHQLGISSSQVSGIVHRLSLPIRPHNRVSADKRALVLELRQTGLAYREIAEIVGLSVTSVAKVVVSNPSTKRSE